MSDDVLQWEINDGVCWAVLRRQHARNAVDFEVMSVLERLLDTLEAGDGLRVSVFTAEGSHFISGGDLRAFSSLKTAAEGRAMALRMRNILDRIERLPHVTVALVNGDAYGGGCETALAFDQIWLSAGASMGFTQANFALNPGWGGHLRLMERVGANRALRWLAERCRVGPEEALASGLVDHVLGGPDLRAAAMEHVHRILSTDVGVLRALKAVKRHYVARRDSELMDLEANLFADLWAAEPHLRKVRDFLERPR